MSFVDFMSDYNRANEHRVYGAIIGIVTNNKDPEKLGRVKLKIPVRLGEKETDWARVASLMAGNDKGVYFLPEVGDEVLVIFNEGDIRQPFVIGSLWNNKEKPPQANENGKNEIKQIKSRVGHEITISDNDSEGFIEIKTKNGNVVKIYDEGNGKIELKDKSGANKILIDGDGKTIDIASDSSINVKSKTSSIKIDGNSNSIDVKSDAKISISSANIEIKAKGNLNLNSDGIVNIKGSMVKIN